MASSDSGQEGSTEQLGNMRVGFVGAGRMAQAIAKGFTTQGIIKAKNIWASARTQETLKKMREFHVNVTLDNAEVVDRTDVLILSVKPQVMDSVLSDIAEQITHDKLVVSIAAGVTVQFLEDRLNPKSRVVRVMPNTPMLANAGASVYCVGREVLPEDSRLIEALFSSVGTCDYLPEHLMDVATGLSGSGPAYTFIAIEAMADTGVKLGLPRNLALKLAAQTVHGAGRLVLESGRHPAELKDGVTSPGGTAIAGIHELETRGFRSAIMSAIEKATLRAQALGAKNK